MKACRKFNVSAYSRLEGDRYLVIFKQDIEFRSFKAAKYMVNALVLERREKDRLNNANSLTVDGLNFSPYPVNKKRVQDSDNWGERRLQSWSEHEKSRP
ncbi:hypothetical protein ACFLRI_05205 [Bacteroidota bacterium]